MIVRQATLDDTRAIVVLFTTGIEKWQRLNNNAQVEDLTYEQLTIYERWLHGGAWMSLETGVIWISHVLSGAGIALVVEDAGVILAYAEAFYDHEAAPFGKHLYLAQLKVAKSAPDTVHELLAEAILQTARGVGRLTVSYPDYDPQTASYYRKLFGVSELSRFSRYTLNAQTGQSFYKASDFEDSDFSLIEAWHFSIGRWTSSRDTWESEWTDHWKAVPQIIARKKHRLRMNAAGHEAIICYYQHLYNARAADVYCWSPKPLSSQLIVAIRDWGHRAGYRSLVLSLPNASASLLPAETPVDPHKQVIAAIDT